MYKVATIESLNWFKIWNLPCLRPIAITFWDVWSCTRHSDGVKYTLHP